MLHSKGELSVANQLILPMEYTWNYTSEPNTITRIPRKRKAGESQGRRGDGRSRGQREHLKMLPC